MTISERQLIEDILERGDRKRHDKAVNTLFYGNSLVTTSIKNAVFKIYSNSKYSLVRSEIYPTFVSVFYKRLIEINPDTLRTIKNLAAYFYRTTWHFLLEDSIRKEIDFSLGIDDTHTELNLNLNHDENDNDEEDGQILNSNQESSTEDDEEQDDAEGWERFFLNPYIQKIQGKNRDRILSDLQSYIMDEPSKVYAARINTTVDDVDNRCRRAHLELIRVALPDILNRTRTMFARFGDNLSSSNRELLNEFYTTGDYGDKNRQKAIAKAFKSLWIKANSAYKKEQKQL